MSKLVRRSLLLVAMVALAAPLSTVASSAQAADDLNITVRKTVVGTGTGPSSVTMTCESNAQASAFAESDIVLSFDAQGHPTTVVPDEGFTIEGGAWVLHGTSGSGGSCTFTETATGGATSTAWTCAYDFTPFEVPQAEQIQQAGCQTASGAGVGPATVLYPSDGEVASQSSEVVFTNTFVAQAAAEVVVQPAFTG